MFYLGLLLNLFYLGVEAQCHYTILISQIVNVCGLIYSIQHFNNSKQKQLSYALKSIKPHRWL